MKNYKLFLLAFSFSILLSGCNTFQKTPGHDEVKKSAGEIVKILEKTNNLGSNRSLFSMGKNPGILQLIIRNASTGLIILIITVFAAAVIYFVSERISLGVYGNLGEREREEKLNIEPYDPDIPGKLASEGKFSDAVLYLYRASILNISKSGLPYSKGMTNFMVYTGIKNPELRDSFKNICDFADRVLFDSHEASGGEYKACMKEFEVLRGVRL